MDLNIVSFKTANNKYIFDGNTSNIITVDDITEYIINNYDDNPENIFNNFSHLSPEIFYRKYEYVKKLFEKGMFKSGDGESLELDIKTAIYEAPTMSLILVLTGKCNLRCEYCVYNDKYPREISYEDIEMEFETAKRAIDQYFSLFENRKKRGFFKIPSILFYGGEPLLHKGLIKQVVEYIESKKYPCGFYMTTNAVLLDKDFAKFCVEKNFRITFSLDGYKYNHDRNRVTIDKKPTFDVVLKNILEYQRIKREMGKVQITSFNCCYDDYTDLEKCIDFFVSNGENFAPMYVVYSYISPYDTTYYDWLKKNENLIEGTRTNFVESYNKIREKFLRGEYRTEYEKAAVQHLMLGAYAISIRNKDKMNPLNNSCIPLSKLAVYSDGTYAICEKLNKRLPIGNVSTGIDYERMQEIADMLKNTLENGRCSKCPLKRLCNVCFQFLEETGEINYDYCEREKKALMQMLIDYCSMRENNPSIMEYYSQTEETSEILNVLN